MEPLLRWLLTAAPHPQRLEDVAGWWASHLESASRFAGPADVALAGGFSADRLAYAFASGYQAALRALLPELPRERRYALCATESGGGHPSAMQTRLTRSDEGGLTLEGTKTFVTLGTAADELLVVATEGQDAQGRNRLRLVRVDPRRPGVTLNELPPAPFVPELPHAEVQLKAVPVSMQDVLPGDGYERYLKPFRTVEDCHVLAAVLGWLLQVARRSGWPDPVREQLLALAVTLHGLAREEPRSAAVHLALAGALELLSQQIQSLEPLWAQVDAPTRERWMRDRALLHVAGRVRAKRLEAARQKLLAPG
jgi:acyl-CoA dehydrogenase